MEPESAYRYVSPLHLEDAARAFAQACSMQQNATSSTEQLVSSWRRSGPRDVVAALEATPTLPPGIDERFSGWGVMGLPFSSGHYLALRRFAASSMWRNPLALNMIGLTAPMLLQAGKVRLHGAVPNGQWFQANPRRLWLITSCRARLGGEDFGSSAALPAQVQLGDLWLPQRGLFFTGEAYLESLDTTRHYALDQPGVAAVPQL
jgi:hypothetical protein